jgi:tyrosyl-tRNA synthetase
VYDKAADKFKLETNHDLIDKYCIEMDKALVTRTEAKALRQFGDGKKSAEKKVQVLNKLFSRLNKPFVPKTDLKQRVHKAITSEVMSYLVG